MLFIKVVWGGLMIPLVFKGRHEEDKGTNSADIGESIIAAGTKSAKGLRQDCV